MNMKEGLGVRCACGFALVALLTAGSSALAVGPTGDQFNDPSLNGTLWTFTDPIGDATQTMTGTQLSIEVPGGSNHDMWVNGADAPRVVQSIDDEDFEVEVKIDSIPNARFQLIGISVEQDNDTFLRFDFYHDGTDLRIFAARLDNGSSSIQVNDPVVPTGGSVWVRVARAGDSFTQSYSLNGTDFTEAGTITFAMTVAQLGVYAGNSGGATAPAFTGLVDYFVVPGQTDLCPGDPNKTEPGQCGCGNPDTDTDGDGTADCIDGCVNDPNKSDPGDCGCGNPDTDTDGDGDADCIDACPNDPANDSDGDGICGDVDNCPSVSNPGQEDGDGDGIGDACEGAPGAIDPDAFNDPTLNESIWTYIDPFSDATQSMTGTQLSIEVPGGSNHEMWTNGAEAPRIVQAVNNPDFEVEIKVDSIPAERFQLIGLTVEQDNGRFQRYDFYHDGTDLRIFAAKVNGSTPSNQVNEVITGAGSSLWMRVSRTGDSFTQSYSLNGTDFTETSTFSDDLTVNQIGVYVGNSGGATAPAFTGLIDYFLIPGQTDLCPGDPNKTEPGQCGCGNPDTDTDGDGTADCIDGCVNDPNKSDPGDCGCGNPDTDTDGDGDADCIDACPNDPANDSDGDGVCGDVDNCPTVSNPGQEDTDGDGTGDACEGLPGELESDQFNDPTLNENRWTFVDPLLDGTQSMTGTQLSIEVPGGSNHDMWTNGAEAPRVVQTINDTDFEVEIKIDSKPSQQFQLIGISVEQSDTRFLRFDFFSDGSGVRVFAASLNGASQSIKVNAPIADTSPLWMRVKRVGDTFTQSYSTDGANFTEAVMFDSVLSVAQVGIFVANSGGASAPAFTGLVDYFVTLDPGDSCPADPNKTEPGQCGCGVPDTDTDGDGTADCIDGCPSDPDKADPGDCGCGNPDIDTDGDGTADCIDGCVDDPNKTEPGDCGCGNPDTDTDGDGVADCIDLCPGTFPGLQVDADGCPTSDVFYFEDFEGFGLNTDPTNWFDTGADNSTSQNDSLYKVLDVAGNKTLGTTSELLNIHSHYVGPGAASWTNYEYSGRMRLGNVGGGTGVTFLSDYPNSDTYYRLRRYGAVSAFHISPHGTSISGGDTDSGVAPLANTWYRFRIDVEDTGSQTNIKAKVWEEGDPEPTNWQIDCWDSSPSRITAGTIGVWNLSTGGKYFDDLQLRPNVCSRDTDSDGTVDCLDGCPEDGNKTEPGICGCGISDADDDGDGIINCDDNCPDTPNADQTDSNGNGIGDVCEPPVITNIQAAPTDNTCTITWTTNEPATSVVDYGLDTNYDDGPASDPALVTNHSVLLTGLAASSEYHYKLTSTNAGGFTGMSEDMTFTTLPDSTPPVISDIKVTFGTGTATIHWKTDEPADSTVDYGVDTNYDDGPVTDAALVQVHAVVLTGLVDQQEYHYQITSEDGNGNASSSVDLTFTAMTPASSGIVSDDFSNPPLDMNTWTFINPLEDATLSMTGSQASIEVPAGTSHDMWVLGPNAPRIMQCINDTDFEVIVKFETLIDSQFQIMGLVVAENVRKYVRLDFFHNGSALSVFAAGLNGGSSQQLNVQTITNANPLYMKVNRTGDDWVQSYSYDGQNWTDLPSFDWPLTVSSIGVFVGNSGGNPAVTGLVDFFFDAANPIDPEDEDLCPGDPEKLKPGVCGCGTPDVDTDGDGTLDCNDECPNDPNKILAGDCGCGSPETDSDGDGTADCVDNCPSDPNKVEPGECGCGNPETDTDGDGTADCIDGCVDDPNKTDPGECGCGTPDTDTDGDGTPDCNDACVDDPNKVDPGQCGCGTPDTDTDGDGTPDCNDLCPDDPNKVDPGQCDCGTPDTDTDGDGTADCIDGCVDDPNKTDPGQCGCGTPDTDTDGDGTPDCNDLCPDDPNKVDPGVCDCGTPDDDTDGDGTLDCEDGCPNDPDKIDPGVCGCGTPDTDTDGDGTPDCNDLCPDDPDKVDPGQCDCGTPDTDTDGDGTADCNDGCVDDPNKIDPGVCGCDVPDTDTDGDGTPDCNDSCVDDPNKIDPGVCGCDVPDTDTDGDGTPDCNDGCPGDPNKLDPGVCGCDVPDTDTDGDGTPDCNDLCPDDPDKVDPGQCGCGDPDTDTDGDGTADCNDGCVDDPDKIDPGVCGCGTPDDDTDGDGTPDCNDLCPNDPNKVDPGVCGCGIADDDTDGDGTLDCEDGCVDDPNKTEPGACGCGTPDDDTDGDGTPNCLDNCPDDPNKVDPGQCDCGTPDTDSDGDTVADCVDNCPDTPNQDQTDTDGDGVGDACELADVTVTGWRSVYTHDELGNSIGPIDLAIMLDPSAVGDGPTGPVSEPRKDGVKWIEVDFDVAVGVIDGTVEAEPVGGGAPIAAAANLINGGLTLELLFAGGLPDQGCYRIDLTGHVPGLTGDADCLVRSLIGDINSDGVTNLIDYSVVKGNNGAPVLPDNTKSDVNADGSINLIDAAEVKQRNGNATSCQ